MISFKSQGEFKKTEKFFKDINKKTYRQILEKYAKQGLSALISATPQDSGKTAQSWYYRIKESKGLLTIFWYNSNIVDSFPVAVMIQYGHGTKGGGYVRGRDYINPAMRPIFDKIAEEAWKEVTK